jgi:hypothetical protein
MDRTTLDGIPNELFDCVLQYLKFNSIGNLRLANRAFNARATQKKFRSCFQNVHLYIEQSKLESFAAVAKGPMGRLVENLVIVGLAHDLEHLSRIIQRGEEYVPHAKHYRLPGEMRKCTPKELDVYEYALRALQRQKVEQEMFFDDPEAVEFLRQVFMTLAAHDQYKLHSLSMEFGVFQKPAAMKIPWHDLREIDERLMLATASKTCSVICAAISSTSMSFDSLTVFHMTPRYYELPCNELSRFEWEISGYAPMISTLKSLSLFISDPISAEQTDTNDILWAKLSKETNFSSIPKLLKAC